MSSAATGRDQSREPISQSVNHTSSQSQRGLKIWFCLQGFSEEVMSVLRNTSRTTSQEQLKTVLQEALSRGHIKRADTKEAATTVLADLENPDSELHKTMASLKPLQYV